MSLEMISFMEIVWVADRQQVPDPPWIYETTNLEMCCMKGNAFFQDESWIEGY